MRVYIVRHAKPDFSIHDDLIRPLTEEGFMDSKKVTDFLLDKMITKVYSSPYKRAIDTVKDFADRVNLPIEVIDDFKERKIADEWIEDFHTFSREQWLNFDYKLETGECLAEVQKRNVAALKQLVSTYPSDNIVIGSHGTALSTMIHFFNPAFDYEGFNRIKDLMPFIVCFTFEGETLQTIEEFIL